jgi:ubiquinone biosynthesis protein UbiJ
VSYDTQRAISNAVAALRRVARDLERAQPATKEYEDEIVKRLRKIATGLAIQLTEELQAEVKTAENSHMPEEYIAKLRRHIRELAEELNKMSQEPLNHACNEVSEKDCT